MILYVINDAAWFLFFFFSNVIINELASSHAMRLFFLEGGVYSHF